MTDVSVIIPSYRSWPLIARTLTALQAQTFPGTLEVLIIDSSDDDTPAAVASAFPEVQVHHLAEQTFPGAARNRGIGLAQGMLLAFVDADAVPQPDWLEQHWRLHQAHPDVAAIGGSIGNANGRDFIGRIAHLLEFSGYTPGWPAREARVAPTCNLSLKRELLGEARFLEGTWGNEDVELLERLRQSGQTLRFEPAARVDHFSKTDFTLLCQQQRKLGYSTAVVRRAYDLPGSWLARTPGAWMLIPLLKTGILWRRALAHEQGAAALLVMGAPWITIALGHWTAGFRQGLHAPPLPRP